MTASGTTVYPGIYRARCVAATEGRLWSVYIPQVFGTTLITVTDYVVFAPVAGTWGYVSFEGGDSSFPTWLSGHGDTAGPSSDPGSSDLLWERTGDDLHSLPQYDPVTVSLGRTDTFQNYGQWQHYELGNFLSESLFLYAETDDGVVSGSVSVGVNVNDKTAVVAGAAGLRPIIQVSGPTSATVTIGAEDNSLGAYVTVRSGDNTYGDGSGFPQGSPMLQMQESDGTRIWGFEPPYDDGFTTHPEGFFAGNNGPVYFGSSFATDLVLATRYASDPAGYARWGWTANGYLGVSSNDGSLPADVYLWSGYQFLRIGPTAGASTGYVDLVTNQDGAGGSEIGFPGGSRIGVDFDNNFGFGGNTLYVNSAEDYLAIRNVGGAIDLYARGIEMTATDDDIDITSHGANAIIEIEADGVGGAISLDAYDNISITSSHEQVFVFAEREVSIESSTADLSLTAGTALVLDAGTDVFVSPDRDSVIYGAGGQVNQTTRNAAPIDARMLTQSVVFYLDEGTNKLKARARYTGGTYKTGEMALV